MHAEKFVQQCPQEQCLKRLRGGVCFMPARDLAGTNIHKARGIYQKPIPPTSGVPKDCTEQGNKQTHPCFYLCKANV